MKKALKIVGILLLALVVVAGGYVAYVFIDYHRLPDTDEALEPFGGPIAVNAPLTLVSWNLGFGAYSDDYSVFMDGGKESWAFSKDAVLENIGHATDVLAGLAPDLMLLQEVDIDSTRSYHVDEAALLKARFAACQACFAQNYDSPFLFYPFTKPHGASRSGLLTLSKSGVSRFARVGLPVEKGFNKLLDLDRCYSKAWIPEANGGTLVLYDLHLSAYTSDGTIAQEQLELLCADMLKEAEAGHNVIAGGDFNKDLLGDSAAVFGEEHREYSWNQPIPEGTIPEGLTLVAPLDETNPVPSNRLADAPYVKGRTFVNTLDGFIVSDNVKVISCGVVDDGFKCSDHNPVTMQFELTEE